MKDYANITAFVLQHVGVVSPSGGGGKHPLPTEIYPGKSET